MQDAAQVFSKLRRPETVGSSAAAEMREDNYIYWEVEGIAQTHFLPNDVLTCRHIIP